MNVEGARSTDLPTRQLRLQTSESDVLRAALCSLSYVSPQEAGPVHVLRLRSCCERLGLSESIHELLVDLELMREVQDLGAGYWIPTPTRTVRLPGCKLIISANSTRELERLLGIRVELGGIGRTVSTEQPTAMPEEATVEWIGSPTNLSQWTQDIVDRARSGMQPTVHPDERVEVYAPWLLTTGARWGSVEDVRDSEPDEPFVCRAAGRTGRRWFFARIKGARIVEEYAIDDHWLRLLYGLDLRHGTSARMTIRCEAGRDSILLRAPIPQEERRVLIALTRPVEADAGTTYEFAPRYRPAVESVLRRIGFSVR
jgi:hypothetical protein